jgi:FdhD protein
MEEKNERSITSTRNLFRYRDGKKTLVEDTVVMEVPLTIMLNDEELATIVCSPYAGKELVMGFLSGEGFIRDPDDIKDYFHREKQEVVWVETHSPVSAETQERFMCRNFTSCCGKGRPTMYYMNDLNQVKPVNSGIRFSPEEVFSLMKKIEEGSSTFKTTGAVHTAALSDRNDILVKYEDIGRHNALDRIMGHVFLNRIDTADMAVILSGRISSEMLIKSARIGVSLVISRSAPTALALDIAEELGLTIAGFVRGRNMNVYTRPERIE